ASGAADGSLRTWDVARGVQAGVRAGNAARPNPINALAYSPDDLSIVIGQEAPGRLFQFQAEDLAAPPALPPTLNGHGPVEGLAFHPDARRPRLAVGIKSDASEVPDPMRISCDVEIREIPAGPVVRDRPVGVVVHRRRVSGLVHALSFSPDGRRLAY